jgi:ankyrin repeat protein
MMFKLQTPLMWAAENANIRNGVAMVAMLIEYGSDVNQMDENGNTAFDRLCSTSGNVKAAELLIAAGARVINVIHKEIGHTVTSLMTAALNGHKDLCRELMDKWGADPRVETEHGGNAKSFSEAQGHRMVSEMISAKINEM